MRRSKNKLSAFADPNHYPDAQAVTRTGFSLETSLTCSRTVCPIRLSIQVWVRHSQGPPLPGSTTPRVRHSQRPLLPGSATPRVSYYIRYPNISSIQLLFQQIIIILINSNFYLYHDLSSIPLPHTLC